MALAFVNAAALYTHYFAAVIIAFQFIFFLLSLVSWRPPRNQVSGAVSHPLRAFLGLLAGVAVLAWGLYSVLGKRLIVRYGAIHASALTLLLGTVMFLPAGIVPMLSYPFAGLTTAEWGGILYLGLVTSVLSYFLWYFALGRIEAGKAALFANLQPIVTTVLAVLLLGQDITLAFLVGGSIALAGVTVAQFG